MKYELPKLPYAYDALEPHIDARTMEIHYTKHHATYVTKLNEVLSKHPEIQNKSLEEMLRNIDSVPEDIRGAVRNHGGGHLNHSLFWKVMKSPVQNGGIMSHGKIGQLINQDFGDFDKFREEFNKVALGVFGSGWTWLVVDGEKLSVVSTPNQDSPLMKNMTPILGLDVWEHAYYLKYQNRRSEYIDAWWYVVNWAGVEENLAKVKAL